MVDRVGAGGVVDEDHELVTAEPGHPVAQTGRQAVRHRLDQQIAVVVAERVVHGLEVVEVDEHDRREPLPRGGAPPRGQDPVLQSDPVGQAGQVVVVGLFGEPGDLALEACGQPVVDVEGVHLARQDQRHDCGAEQDRPEVAAPLPPEAYDCSEQRHRPEVERHPGEGHLVAGGRRFACHGRFDRVRALALAG